MTSEKIETSEWRFSDFAVLNGREENLRKAWISDQASPSSKYKLEDFRKEQEKNRGIIFNGKTKTIDTNIFSGYLLNRFSIILMMGKLALYNYRFGKYVFIPEDDVKSFFYKVIEEYDSAIWTMNIEKSYFTEVLRRAKSYRNFTIPKDKLVFLNGTLSISENKFYPGEHNPQIINFYSLEYEYNTNAECNEFKNFLNDVFNGDESVIANVQEMFGYTFLYGEYPIQKLFLLYGVGRNGKGVLMKLLTELHNPMNVSAVFLDDLSERFGKQEVWDKVLNISGERSQKKPLDTAVIKTLTGNDPISVENKYEKAFTTYIYCKFIVCSNEPIETTDGSNGYLSRLLPIEFPNVYRELHSGEQKVEGNHYQDKNLFGRLKEELPGILKWALEGLFRLKGKEWNLTQSDNIDNLKMKYYYMGQPVKHFFDSCVEKGTENDSISTSLIYQYFTRWANENDISTKCFNQVKVFHEAARHCLDDINCSSTTKLKNGNAYYFGIKIKKNWVNITLI
ncbi:phage/plasmid primase, P4 family, C-terminal domain-containing protein [[Clostridium] fimetarium]|uniref:Phage/plasmid primase, P4 family, C-terminal domain-containing protein n=2 Tax=[Clostridium] fimetarium TaxID=99656 RepID=A0A1I0MYZ7_9FIRM|nr:phage/plasmid primase, P4 family, C-terminal domain-containing protein [[Clostridium] fimetarium]